MMHAHCLATNTVHLLVYILCFVVYRFIFVSNHLPLKCVRAVDDASWDFSWDEDALIAQAQVLYSVTQVASIYKHVGSLTV